MAIKISVTGLVKFMKSGPATQRTLLKAYKFPTDKDGKKRPQIVRYSEARAAIKKYHENSNDVATLLAAVTALQKKAATADPDKDISRLKDNIRAIEAYMKYFSKNKFVVLENPRPKYTHSSVEVSTSPDLFVEENGSKKLIKLDFNASPLDVESIKIILKVMYEAAISKSLGVNPKDVIYLDVSRNEQYNGAKLNKKLKKDIDAACETIEDIWPKVKQ
jgi:hypothetical protein